MTARPVGTGAVMELTWRGSWFQANRRGTGTPVHLTSFRSFPKPSAENGPALLCESKFSVWVRNRWKLTRCDGCSVTALCGLTSVLPWGVGEQADFCRSVEMEINWSLNWCISADKSCFHRQMQLLFLWVCLLMMCSVDISGSFFYTNLKKQRAVWSQPRQWLGFFLYSLSPMSWNHPIAIHTTAADTVVSNVAKNDSWNETFTAQTELNQPFMVHREKLMLLCRSVCKFLECL